MCQYNIYESIVDKDIKKEFVNSEWCPNLMYYATWKCKIDGLIAAAYLFSPEIVEIEGHIFLKQFCNFEEGNELEFLNKLKQEYSNKKDIEMRVNTWSIGSFFLGENTELMDNNNVLEEFGKVLVYFWKKRMDELFPEKNIIVELGANLFGEYGLSITLYEDIS